MAEDDNDLAPQTPQDSLRSLLSVGGWRPSGQGNDYTLTRNVAGDTVAAYLKFDLQNVGVKPENIKIETKDGKTSLSILNAKEFNEVVFIKGKLLGSPTVQPEYDEKKFQQQQQQQQQARHIAADDYPTVRDMPNAASRLSEATQSAIALGTIPEAAAKGTETALNAGAQAKRFYHNVDHFEDIAKGADKIKNKLLDRGISPQTAEMMTHAYRVAGRDHDAVYANADGKIPDGIDVSAYVQKNDKGQYVIKSDDSRMSFEQKQNLQIAKEIFDYKAGDILNPFSGQNEFLSALHSLDTNKGMSLQGKIATSAMIASTIPFQNKDSISALAGRAAKIQIDRKNALTSDQVHGLGLASAHFANRDVASFDIYRDGPDKVEANREKFLSNTRDLLREGGADLTNPQSISQKAMAMAGFMRDLSGKMVEGKAVVFRNYTFHSNGKDISLLSPEALFTKNSNANELIKSNAQMLHGMVVASQVAELDGETRLPGGNQGKEIESRALNVNKKINDPLHVFETPLSMQPEPPSAREQAAAGTAPASHGLASAQAQAATIGSELRHMGLKQEAAVVQVAASAIPPVNGKAARTH